LRATAANADNGRYITWQTNHIAKKSRREGIIITKRHGNKDS